MKKITWLALILAASLLLTSSPVLALTDAQILSQLPPGAKLIHQPRPDLSPTPSSVIETTDEYEPTLSFLFGNEPAMMHIKTTRGIAENNALSSYADVDINIQNFNFYWQYLYSLYEKSNIQTCRDLGVIYPYEWTISGLASQKENPPALATQYYNQFIK